jgi:predicted permease
MALSADVRLAIRSLRRSPAFTVPAVASLALGIAVNTTMFTVVNAALLRPFGGLDSGGLVRVGRTQAGERHFRSSTTDELAYLRRHAASFDDLLGEQMEAVAAGGPDGSEMVAAELVTLNYFSLLRVTPALGRTFGEGGPAADDPVAVISDAYWRRRFGADPTVAGRTLLVNNVPLAIAGVAPPGFGGTFPGLAIDLWVPVTMAAAVKHQPPGRDSGMQLIGRLRPGVSIATALAELRILARRLAAENPDRDPNREFAVAPARGVHPAFAAPLSVFLLLLMAAVAVVLLIACANVASLLLARGSARQGELAVRRALGASRGRLVSHLLVESLILALLGGAGGALLAIWPVRVLNHVFATAGPGGVPAFLDLQVDARVLAFTAVVTALTAVACGLFPALRASSIDVAARAATRPPPVRARGALLVAQVALAFVLLVAAGLLFRSLRQAGTIDVGVEPDAVVVASFADLRTFGYDAARTAQFHAGWLARVRAHPGIEAAAMASFVPLAGGAGHPVTLEIRGDPADGRADLDVQVGRISDGYFGTVGQRLVRGRDFTPHDLRSEAPRVAIVNEAFVHRYGLAESPLGSRIRLGEDLADHEIVGVAHDARYASLAGDVAPFVYTPALPLRGTLHARSAANPSQVIAAVRQLGHDVEPRLPPFSGRPMRDAMAAALLPAVISQIVLGTAGAIAFLLAAGGLYGLVCYTLERRLREIGIRVALGATRADVRRLIVGGAARLTLIGIAIGVVIAALATRLLAAVLYGLSPTDTLTFVVIAALLLTLSVAAAGLALRQGLRAGPAALLRAE